VIASRFDQGGSNPRRARSVDMRSHSWLRKASSQVRDDPKGGGLACICKYFLYELHVMVNTCII